jgi:CRISPR-associated protein (TIGR02710 family)
MLTFLFITVGGSPAPIITAIQSLQPDRVIFICSTGPRGSLSQVTGPGQPCEIRQGAEVVDRLPNLPTHLNLGDRFNPETDLITLENPDDLAEAYQQISAKMRQLRQTHPNAQLLADYTGGTKTMTLALGAAALDQGVTLYLTTSATRENLIRVERGESTGRAPTTTVAVERTLNQTIPGFLAQYNYPAAVAQIQTLLADYELPPDQKRQIHQQRDIWAGFDAWDRFDHATASQLLEPYLKQIQAQGLFLKRVMHSRSQIDPKFHPSATITGHGYELVEDLLLNADRRAHQHRYDDAVGRLYRALELLVQLRLKLEYQIETGNVDLEQLPAALWTDSDNQRNPRNGKIKLALTQSYELLSHLGDPPDPLGQLYQQQANDLLNTLQVRNHSLFAHGFQPIAATDYATFNQVIQGFIQAGLQAVISNKKIPPPVQFPMSENLSVR